MAKTVKAFPFVPYKGMVALEVPQDVYPDSKLITPGSVQWDELIEDKSKKLVNTELVVAAVGEGPDFVKVGDTVILNGHARVQRLDSAKKGKEKHDTIWWVIRESDIMVKKK